MNKKYRGSFDRHLGLLFAAVLAVFLIINIILPDKAMSFTENRPLAQFPRVSPASLSLGTYADDFETYLSDQFAGRDGWRNAVSFIRWVGGNRKEQGVYSAPGGQLLAELIAPAEGVLEANTAFINSAAAKVPGGNVLVCLVPDAGAVMPNRYPPFSVNADQAALFAQVKDGLDEGVVWIDAASAMKDSGVKKLYYKTDHHWTTAGAKTVYEAFCGMLHTEPASFTAYTVSRTFNGSLSALSGFCMLERETIEIYVPEEEESVVLTYTDEQKKKATLYDRSKLDTSDQYAVFLGGNSSVIDISTTAKSERSILVVKDSFANCFIPFLTQHYSRIIVVDPRYYYGDVNGIFTKYAADDVLFLYSGNTFFEARIAD